MPLVEFQHNGLTYRFRDRIDFRSVAVTRRINDLVPVIFSPDDPGTAMIDNKYWNYLPWAPMLALAFFILAVPKTKFALLKNAKPFANSDRR